MFDLATELARAASSVITDVDVMSAYRKDQCLLAGAGRPSALVRAVDSDEVARVVRVCAAAGVPLVTRGAGTGLAGGANAVDGCVILALDKLDRIVEIDPSARTARVQPGVLNADLDTEAAKLGLWYAPDPGSRAISSIGGNIATNAGGMCCAKYGVTRDHVLALTVVTGTGETLRTGVPTRKDVAGLDLKHLLVGSEGTLGVIVEATVRLRPRPGNPATVAATFPSVRSAVALVLDSSAEPDIAAAELMDQATVRAVNAMTKMGLDESAGAVLLLQFDGEDSLGQAERCARRAAAAGAEVFATGDVDEGGALMQARRAALPALERMGSTLLDDVCVAPYRVPALIESIDAIATRSGLTIATFGHVADGNLHPTIVFDAADRRERAAAKCGFEEILSAATDLGGTVTGEHGVGALKVDYARAQLDDVALSMMRGVKAVFDPAGILNPGRAF